VALGSCILREKPDNPASLRQKIVMIICGPGVFGEDAIPIFSKNCRHQQCAFKKIRSNAIGNFRKSGATGSRILENPQEPNQGFKKILSRSCDPATAVSGYSSSAA
jgi:hypothetical protein